MVASYIQHRRVHTTGLNPGGEEIFFKAFFWGKFETKHTGNTVENWNIALEKRTKLSDWHKTLESVNKTEKNEEKMKIVF